MDICQLFHVNILLIYCFIYLGSIFNLGNEAWSGNKKQGDDIAFSLLGDYTSDSSEPIMVQEVSLNGEVMCRGMNTEES